MKDSSSNKIVPSEYQQAILDYIATGQGDLVVSAVAGSGKTTTLELIASSVCSNSALFLAFNTHIVGELERRLAGSSVQAMTIHRTGRAILSQNYGRMDVREDKYYQICRELCEKLWPKLGSNASGKSELWTRANALKRLVELSRLTLNVDDETAIADLASEYNVEADEEVLTTLCEAVKPACEQGVEMACSCRQIDFVDMVWLPVALRLKSAAHCYNYLLVDEAQDLNAAQRELVFSLLRPGGRMFIVGDPYQAIMGFAGADYRSYQAIKELTRAKELPLSICYRCPSSHVALAREIVPHIEARPGAPEGVISTALERNLHRQVQEGDLVLCRKTAPLVSLCINLIRHKVPARVRGRDIASTLVTLAEKLGEYASWDDFPRALEMYRRQRTAVISKRTNPESHLTVHNDTCDALLACYEEFEARDVDGLCRQINGLFGEDRAAVWLSTVHRAKGLEADNVFILHPELLPLKWANQSAEQAVQEMNLKYVALTRARKSLTWVEKGPRGTAMDDIA